MCWNLLQDLDSSCWSVKYHRPTNHVSGSCVRIWPGMTNALGCACILTGLHSLSASSRLIRNWSAEQLLNNPSKFGPYPPHAPALHDNLPPTSYDPVKLWTDGSAFNNGLDSCLAGAAWMALPGLLPMVPLVRRTLWMPQPLTTLPKWLQ